jgi:hypothetical protein
MKKLPLLKIERWKEGNKEKYEKLIENLNNEKNMNGECITNILYKKLTNDFKLAKERNYLPENNAPFDLVAGDEESLGMVGFEIKGDTDNFSRLKNQINEYVYAFDGMYLVLHKKNPPEWMPDFIGILRVFENEDIYIEEHSSIWNLLDIGSNYDWDAVLKSNSLGKCSIKVKETLDIIKSIRKNIMFNRFFAVQDGFNTYKYEKFYPLSEKEKSVIIGFDVPYHMKLLKKDIIECEKKLENIKEIVSLGQQEL